MNLNTSPEELFTLIGEREFIKYKQQQKITELFAQIGEMSQVIDQYRVANTALLLQIEELKNGRLGKSADNDTV
jgi:hypothetical protein